MLAKFAPLVLATLAALQASARPVDVKADALVEVGRFLGLDVDADVHIGKDGVKVLVCLEGYVLDYAFQPARCRWNGPKPTTPKPHVPKPHVPKPHVPKPQPCYPVSGVCQSGWKKHPLLDICIELDVDIELDLSISQPHGLWIGDKCGNGWKRHPKLLGICIKAEIDFDLDLGHHGRRPDWHGICSAGWRKHASILNLCIDATVDIDIVKGNLGRLLLDDGKCTAGWVRHPHSDLLCVDAALDIALFNNQWKSQNGACKLGYRRHPNALLDLCVAIDLDLGLGVKVLGLHL